MLRLCVLLTLLVSALASAVSKRNFGPETVYAPPSSYAVPRTLYARSLMLNDGKGTLLATWENYTPTSTKPYFPIYRSTDHGYTWTSYSTVQDTVNGWGLRYQPHMIQLSATFAGFPAGTILLAGNSIPADLSKTQIDLYASTNSGQSWTFVSHVAAGGKADPTNGQTPVWEPFLMMYNNMLVCYYSDQRDTAHGQKLAHQTTTDGKTWSAEVNDVAYSTYSARPGMTTVSKLPNGQYFMSYEYCGAPEANCAAYYKVSSNPLNFNAVTGAVVRGTDGSVPSSSPFNVWTSIGGLSNGKAVATTNGAIVLNAYSSGNLYVNHNLGQGAWSIVASAAPGAYSRSLAVGFNPKDILVMGGGVLSGTANTVTAYATDVNGCTTC